MKTFTLACRRILYVPAALFNFLRPVIEFSLSLIIDICCALVDAFAQQKGAGAAFGRTRLIGSRFYRGFSLSRKNISRKLSHSNLIITGVTGSGKSSRYIAKSIFTLHDTSLLIHDPSGELYNLTAPYLASKGSIIKIVNFSDSTVSAGYNPLSRIKSLNDVNKFAHLLVSTSLDKGGGDPFWSLSSKQLLAIITRLVLHQPEEYRNLACTIQILNIFASEPQKVDVWIARTNDEKLVMDYKALISNSPKTLQSIVASLKAALECYDSPEIIRVTSCDTLSFDSLRTRPHAIFLHNSIADQSYLSTLTSVFFEQFYSYVLQRLPQKHELDIFCILDEMSSLRVPLLPLALANCRKFRNGNLISIQGKSQLRAFYKEDTDSIISNCLTKVYLPGLTAIDELREIEALSGKCTYIDKHGHEKTKNLITVDEIRQLPTNRSLILSQNFPIIKGWSSPHYHSLIYQRYAKLPPVPMKSDIPDTPIPLLK